MAGKIQNEDIKSSAELVSAGATAASLPNDDKVWVKANSINKTLNQAITDGDIGGSGGGAGKNYAPGSGKFTSITGWNAFNTTYSSGIPTTITTSSTKVAISLESSAPLSSPGSLKFDVTTASGSTGHGFISDAMTIDDQDLGQIFGPTINYWIKTGSSTLDLSGNSTQTFEWWIYNVGNAAWIQPSNFRGMNSSAPSALPMQFQTDISNTSNKNQYRLALIIRNDPTGTSSTLFDTLYFGRGPINFVQPPVTASVYRTVDQSIPTSSLTKVTWSTADVDTAGLFDSTNSRFVAKEAGYYICVAQIPWAVSNAGNRELLILKNGGTFSALGNRAASPNPYDTRMGGASKPIYLNAGDYVELWAFQDSGSAINIAGSYGKEYCNFGIFKVAGSGSGSNSIPVSASYNTASGQSFATSSQTTVQFGTKEFDSHNAFNTSTYVYTAQFSGRYIVCASLLFNSTANQFANCQLVVLKNGVSHKFFNSSKSGNATVYFGVEGTCLVDLLVGETIQIQTYQDSGATQSLQTRGDANFFSIAMINASTANQVSANSLRCRYTLSAQSIPNSTLTTLLYTTKTEDTHNCYNTSTGTFTAKFAGVHNFRGKYSLAASNGSSLDLYIGIYKNGSEYSGNFISYAAAAIGASQNYSIEVNDDVPMNVGDTVTFIAYQINGAARSTNVTSALNTMSVKYVGQ